MIRCPKCGARFTGNPQVIKPGKLYTCRCLYCRTAWNLNGEGIKTDEKADNSRL